MAAGKCNPVLSFMTHAHRSKQLLKPEHELKQIRGIGPALEQILHQAGLFSLENIACMSPEDLAVLFSDVPGLSAERIAKMGWIDQARKLVGNKDSIHETVPPKNRQHSELFSIDLLIDEQNRVRRTHILHVQSLRENSWAGWDQDQLKKFILGNAIPKSILRSTRSTKKRTSLKSDHEQKKPITGDLQLANAEIHSELSTGSNWLVPEDESFTVGLTVDLRKTSISPRIPLQYLVEIYVKDLSNGSHQKIGEKKGGIQSKDLFPLKINCNSLPHGFYRLEACITVSPDLKSPSINSSLTAMTEGQVFRVN